MNQLFERSVLSEVISRRIRWLSLLCHTDVMSPVVYVIFFVSFGGTLQLGAMGDCPRNESLRYSPGKQTNKCYRRPCVPKVEKMFK